MTDTLKRIAGPAALAATAATIYTTPGATSCTITSIHVTNTTAVTQSFTLSVGTDAVGTRFFAAVNVVPGASFDWAGTLVTAATEIVQAYASAATSLTITMSGVETS